MIHTARLLLRGLAEDDLDDLVALDADPQVMFFVTGGVPEFQPSDLPHLIAGGYWAAVERAGGRFVGWFHLRPSAPGDLELGYRLRRDVWGRGYATEGSLALIDHAFTDIGAGRVVAETMVAHTASRRVMEKAGMVQSRHFRADWPYQIPGDEAGDVEYAITREQWARRPARSGPARGPVRPDPGSRPGGCGPRAPDAPSPLNRRATSPSRPRTGGGR